MSRVESRLFQSLILSATLLAFAASKSSASAPSLVTNSAATPAANELDTLAVSKLRYKLRNLEKQEQCSQFCKGLCALYSGHDALADDVSLAKTQLDFSLLDRAVESLRGKRSALANYLDDCLNVVRGIQTPEVATPPADSAGDLSLNLKQLIDENDKLLEENDKLKSRTLEMTAQLNELKKQVEGLENLRTASESKVNKLQDDLEKEKRKLLMETTTSKQLYDELRQQYENTKLEKRSIEGKVSQLEHRNSQCLEKERKVREKLTELEGKLKPNNNNFYSNSNNNNNNLRDSDRWPSDRRQIERKQEDPNRYSIPVTFIDGASERRRRQQQYVEMPIDYEPDSFMPHFSSGGDYFMSRPWGY